MVGLKSYSLPHVILPTEYLASARQEPTVLASISRGVPTLLTAAMLDDLDLLCITLSKDPNLSIADSYGATALHIAVASPTFRLGRYLINSGANIDAPDGSGITPLLEAVYFGNDAAVRALFEEGAKIYVEFYTPKFRTISVTDVEDLVPSILDGNCQWAREHALLTFASIEWSLLHIAVWRGSTSVLKSLLANWHGGEGAHA